MSADKDSDLSTFAIAVIVLWPVALWSIGFTVSILAGLNGCTISAQGPKPCMFLGVDVGSSIYPLWGLGLYLIYAFLWVPIGLVIVGLIRWARRS